MRSRSLLFGLAFVVVLPACKPEQAAVVYPPSLTEVRTGEVVAEDVVVPEDEFIPGIVLAPEQYDYPGEAEAAKTDLTAMQDLADPVELDKHKGTYSYGTADGDMIDLHAENDLVFDDVNQGSIGDCYFAAALTAVLYSDADHSLRDGMIREVKDSDGLVTRYVVRFYDARNKPFDVEVDAQIVRRDGKSLYMRSADSKFGAEEWAPTLIEKAYAQWRGGYEKIGNGGWAGDVMQALTGSTATHRPVSSMTDDALFKNVKASILAHKPVTAGTFGKDDGVNYDGSGVYAWHAYTVMDAVERDGEKYLKLRNPWGSSEPAGNGADDGIFEMKLSDFRRLYKNMAFGGGLSSDKQAPAAVTDLVVDETRADAVVLAFSATGDDGRNGMAAGYDVRVSNMPITNENFTQATAVAAADPSIPGTAETVTVMGLEAGTTYYAALKVEDESGKISGISNVVSFTVGESPRETEYSFTFDEGASGWSTTGLFGLVTEQGSQMFRMGDVQQDNYDVGDRPMGTLTSPPLALPAIGSMSVSWEQLADLEAGTTYDRAWLEVSSGGSWTKVWEKDAVSELFVTQSASLAEFSGQTVTLRFQFDGLDGESNATRGWFIDDVVVGAD